MLLQFEINSLFDWMILALQRCDRGEFSVLDEDHLVRGNRAGVRIDEPSRLDRGDLGVRVRGDRE